MEFGKKDASSIYLNNIILPLKSQSRWKSLKKVLLTADKSLLNDFHLKQNLSQFFYGSGDLLNNWIFKLLVPDPKIVNGITRFAPYPLRKIEAKMMELGYDVSTISYKQIPSSIKDAKVLGIHTVNPLGLAFNTYLRNFINERYEKPRYYFSQLIKNKHIKEAKKDGLKIIVGGQGAWQFESNQDLLDEYGIDCVIIGESELVIDEILSAALKDKDIPRFVRVKKNQIPNIDQISDIKYPSVSGCIEVGRGCPRQCKFCEVTQSKLRWYPLSKIENELIINNQADLKYGILHAEDIFLYGQQSVVPNKKKILDLIRLSKKYHRNIHFTHVSIASSIAIPDLIEHVMELILQDQDYMLVEVGIETGSDKLIKMNMASKMKPFKAEMWSDLTIEALGKMHDNMIIPFCSIIFGLPNETIQDKEKTLELIENLSDYRCIFFPVNFIPLGKLKNHDRQSKNLEDLDDIEKETCFRCIDHDLKWIKKTKRYFYKESTYHLFMEIFSKIWIFQYKRNVSKYKKKLKINTK
ncbi:MAG: B12-binding domain-containing radical SAM protein [Thermoplasmata archaeon]|nr:MAG: B12-binding domain-containing radical SAM protein [Thermoplasmata archaeon]